MLGHGLRQRIPEARPAQIEAITQALQRVADSSRRGMLLMQDGEDLRLHAADDRNDRQP